MRSQWIHVQTMRWLEVVLAAGCLLLSSSCTALKVAGIVQGALILQSSTRLSNYFYNGLPFEPTGLQQVVGGEHPAYFAAVEADDRGWFAEPRQAHAILDSLTSMTRTQNVTVLTFVHGWRHNGQRGDDNVRDFKQTIRYLAHTLNLDSICAHRLSATQGGRNTTVVGVYVGWRGKTTFEWPSCFGPLQALLSLHVYTTFWGRKETADRVGHEDIGRFLVALAQLKAVLPPEAHHDYSLTIVGHSFGGHLVLSALREQLEESLLASEVRAGVDRGGGAAPSLGAYPNQLGSGANLGEVIDPLSCNILLINPAVEAAEMRYLYEVSRRSTLADNQPPLISVFSATNDAARLVFFRVGTAASGFLVPFGSREKRHFSTTALGSEETMFTDTLTLSMNTKAAKDWAAAPLTFDPETLATDVCAGIAMKGGGADIHTEIEDTPSPRGWITVSPLGGVKRPRAVVIVRTDSRLINGHSGFFQRGYVEWLVSYIGMLEHSRLARAEAGGGAQ